MSRIKPGQVYESCQPLVDGQAPDYIRIKVIGEPETTPGMWGYGKVAVVTVEPGGKETRRRAIGVNQLHPNGTTKDGRERRTGYRLIQDA